VYAEPAVARRNESVDREPEPQRPQRDVADPQYRTERALAIEARDVDDRQYPALLRRLVRPDRFPALAAAIGAGVFDQTDDDPLAEFRSGLGQLLDGIAAKAR
jgi:hypothetical protein